MRLQITLAAWLFSRFECPLNPQAEGLSLRSPSRIPDVALGSAKSIPVMLEFSDAVAKENSVVTLEVKEEGGSGKVEIQRRLLSPNLVANSVQRGH